MGWEEVWRLAMKHFIAEPVELRILMGLGLAFLALMVVVGLKHAFRPAAPQPEPRAFEPPVPRKPVVTFAAQPLAAASVAAPAPVAAKPPRQPPRVNKAPLRAARKSVKPTIKPFAPPRPKIRRGRAEIAMPKPCFTEEHAPYTPLPPRG